MADDMLTYMVFAEQRLLSMTAAACGARLISLSDLPALFLSGQYLSVPAAVGFIGVFGVAMLNGIVLISFLRSLRHQGRGVREAVVEGASLRLRPVLLPVILPVRIFLPCRPCPRWRVLCPAACATVFR